MVIQKGRHILYHLTAWALIISQAAPPAAYADSKSLNKDKAHIALAPPSLFADSSPNERSEEFKRSILSDMKLLTVLFSIGAHCLSDNKTTRTLSRTIRDEFRDNQSFLAGIDLENVRREKNIVYIPYRRDSRDYEIRVCSKERLDRLDRADSHWGESANWGIQIVEKIKAPWQAAVDRINPKMAAFDLDGTLSETYGEVRDSICEKIETLLEKGIKVAILSGSRWRGRMLEDRMTPTLEERLWGKIRPELRQNMLIYSDMGSLWGFDRAGAPYLIRSFELDSRLRERIHKVINGFLRESGQLGSAQILDKINGMTIHLPDVAKPSGLYNRLVEDLDRRMKKAKLPILTFGPPSNIELSMVSKGDILETARRHFGFSESDELLVFGDSMNRYGFDLSMTQIQGATGIYVGVEEIELPENIYRAPKTGPAGSEEVLDYLVKKVLTSPAKDAAASRSTTAGIPPQDSFYRNAEAGLKKTKELIARGRLTATSSRQLCRQAAKNFTLYYQRTGQILWPAVEAIGEIAALNDEVVSRPATGALFGGIVEPLMDAFLAEGRAANNELFIHIINICRRAPAGKRLDDKLNQLGFTTEEKMQAWCGRATKPQKFDPGLKGQIKKIIVLSRVTKGADVSITALVLERMKREFPGAGIVYIAPEQQKELFAQDARIRVRPIQFSRRGSLISRLNSWIDLCDIIEDEIRGIEEGSLILDPDSRLSQLAALPMPVKEENYFFFNASRRPEEEGGVLSLSECVNRWLDETFGKTRRQVYPTLHLSERDRQLAAELFDRLGLKRKFVTSMNLGVGGNEDKRISHDFDAKLVRRLLEDDAGGVLILDEGGPFLSTQGREEEIYIDRITKEALSGVDMPVVELVKIPDGRTLLLPGLHERRDSELEHAGRKVHRTEIFYRDGKGRVIVRWVEVAEERPDVEEMTTIEDYWQTEDLDEIADQAMRKFADSPKGLILHRGGVGMLGSLIERSDYYVGYDSMGQHVAAALGVPQTTVFAGFTNETFLARWHSYGRAGKSAAHVIAVDTMHMRKEEVDEEKILGDVLRTVTTARARSHIKAKEISQAQYGQMAVNSYGIARVIAQLNDQRILAEGLTEEITRFQNFSARTKVIDTEVMDTILMHPELIAVLSGLKQAAILDLGSISQKRLEDLKYLLWALKHRTGKAVRIMPLTGGRFYVYDEEYLRYVAPPDEAKRTVTQAGLEISIFRSSSQRRGIYYELSQAPIKPAVLNLAQAVFKLSFHNGANFKPEGELNIGSIFIATFKRPAALRRVLEKQTQNLAEFGHTHIPIIICSNADPRERAANMGDEEALLLKAAYKIKDPKKMAWSELDKLVIEEYRRRGFRIYYVDWDVRDRLVDEMSEDLMDIFTKYKKKPHPPDPTYDGLIREVSDDEGNISLERIKAILGYCLASNISGIRNFTLALGQGQRMVNVDDDSLPVARVVRRQDLDRIFAQREERAQALKRRMYQELSQAAGIGVKDESDLSRLFERIPSMSEDQSQAIEMVIDKYYAYSGDGSTGMIPLALGQMVDSDVEHRIRFDDILHRDLPRFIVTAEDTVLQNMDNSQDYQFDLISVDYLRILDETLGAPVDSLYAGRLFAQDLRGIGGRLHTAPAALKGKRIGIATTHFNGDRDMSGMSLLNYYIQGGARPLDLQRCVDKAVHIETHGFVNPNSQFCYNTTSVDNSYFTVPTIGELYRIEEPYYGYLVRAVVGALTAWSKTMGGHERIPGSTRPNVPHQILNEEVAAVAWDEYGRGITATEREFGASKDYPARMRYLGDQFVSIGRDYSHNPQARERLAALHRDMAKYINTLSAQMLKTKDREEISGIEQTIAELMIEFASSESSARKTGPNETIYSMSSCYVMKVGQDGEMTLYPLEVKEVLEGLQKERKTSFIVNEDEPLNTGINIAQVRPGEPMVLSNGLEIILDIRAPPGSTLYIAGTSKRSLEEFLSKSKEMIQGQMVKDGQTLLIWPHLLESFKKYARDVMPSTISSSSQPLDKSITRSSSSGTSSIKVSASLLSVPDPSRFAQRAVEAIRAGADYVHFDVSEGRKGKTAILEEGSVDTTEIQTAARLRKIKLAGEEAGLYIPIDVHLLVMEPSRDYIKSFIDAGADIISVHWEAFADKELLLKMLQFIRVNGAKAGVVLRPDVDMEEFGKFITGKAGRFIDMISQAGVIPCYEGQVFIYDVLKNIRALRQEFKFAGLIAIDGGVETEISSKRAIEAGADFIVAGSAFFGDGSRSIDGLKIAAKSLKDTAPAAYSSVYDVIADRILELKEKKKGKLWVRISGYHSGGKTETAKGLIDALKAKNGDLNINYFPQDDFWSDREVRKQRRRSRDPAYSDGMTHLRKDELNRAIERLSSSLGDVTFNNIYDFDSGRIDGVKTHHVTRDSIMIVEGCYMESVDKKDFDLSVFIKTDIRQAKERAMERDAVKVKRDPKDTQDLYEEVYEPTYARYLERYKPEESADIVLDTTIVERPHITASKTIVKLLECLYCHKQFTIDTRITRCPFCGGDLEFKMIGDVDFESSIIETDRSMWRYRKILPVDERSIVTAGEGNTPVVYLGDLSRKLGIELYAKLETENPTGTFKDREASFVISRTKQLGQDDVVMQSTGNTGVAISYYAGLAGIRSYFFGPLLSRYKLLMPDKKETSKIILIDGEPVDVKAAATDFALIRNFPKVSPFYERCEANTTQGYEIAESILKGTLPNFDFYVQTIAAGMGPIGFFTGMERVSKWKKGAVAIPRIVAVQISEFAPVQEAWEQDLEQVGPEGITPRFASKTPFEPTLHTTNAPSYYPFLRRLLNNTNGILTKVEPDSVRSREEELRGALRQHGVALTDTENSSFVGYAGLVQQIERGAIPKGSKVILMVTGKGAKKYIEAKPDAIIPPGYDSKTLLKELGRDDSTARSSSSGLSRKPFSAPPQDMTTQVKPDIGAVMDIIHDINLKVTPPVEVGRTLWHVIPISLIPQGPLYNQRTKFVEFVSEMNRLYPAAREKLKVVTEKQDLAAVVEELASDPANIVDAALDDEGYIDMLPDGVKMLVFKPMDGNLGNFRQLEGILTALRALHIDDTAERQASLSRIYSLLTGRKEEMVPDAIDPKEFARKFIFILPPVEIKDVEELRRLNQNLLRFIESV